MMYGRLGCIPAESITSCRIGKDIILTRYEGYYRADLERNGKIIEAISDSFENCWRKIEEWRRR